MKKATLTIILITFSYFCKGQTNLENRFIEANFEMSLRNMYQRIVWNMQPTNNYFFDQTKGEVKYEVEENDYEVIIKPKILGTYNLKDKTFLWSDKNPSINDKLNDKVDTFRKTLPEKYQKDKFKSTTELNENLLSLFSLHLNANGFDYQRQNNTIIYYSLLDLHIFKHQKEILVLEPKNHVDLKQEEDRIDIMKQFHREKLEVNKLYHEEKISSNEAFKKMNTVHLKYWLNEDSYFFPSLSWPCDFDEKSIINWKVFSINDNRLFVMYTTDLGWRTSSYAYEIDTPASGNKVIINEY